MFWYFAGNVFVYIIIVSSLIHLIREQQRGKQYKLPYWFLLPCFIWLGTYAYCTGDYAHYGDIVSRLGINIENATHIERYYVVLIELTNANYEIWRLIIYVLIFLLMYQALWLSKRDSYYSLLWFSLLMLPEAINAVRTTLAFWAFLVGLLYVNNGGKKSVLSIIYFWIAIEAHKSIAPLLLLLPFCFIRLNRVMMVSLCFLVPISSILLENTVFSFLVDHGLVAREDVINYSTYSRGVMNSIGDTIEFFIYRIPYIVISVALVIRLIKLNRVVENSDLKKIASFTNVFVLFLLGTLFLFGYNNPMYYRYEMFLWYFFLILGLYLFPRQYYLRGKYSWYLLYYLLFVQVFRLALGGYYESFIY